MMQRVPARALGGLIRAKHGRQAPLHGQVIEDSRHHNALEFLWPSDGGVGARPTPRRVSQRALVHERAARAGAH